MAIDVERTHFRLIFSTDCMRLPFSVCTSLSVRRCITIKSARVILISIPDAYYSFLRGGTFTANGRRIMHHFSFISRTTASRLFLHCFRGCLSRIYAARVLKNLYVSHTIRSFCKICQIKNWLSDASPPVPLPFFTLYLTYVQVCVI